MIQGFPFYTSSVTTAKKENQQRLIWSLLFAGTTLLSILLGLFLIRGGPDEKYLAWFLYIAGIFLIIYQPRWGIYLIILFNLIGDATVIPWYPFIKNFSSGESILYLNSSVIFSPMESYMVLLVVVCLVKGILERKWKFYTGELFLPTVILLFFIFFGFIFGKINGGNTNIALWEIRPFFHMTLMFFCVSNLFDRKEHYNLLMAFAVLGILIKSLISSDYYLFVMGGNHTGFDSFTDHAASIQINSVFVLLLASWIYSKSLLKKFGLLVLFPPLVLVYLVSQRRAAFATLALAIVFLAILLFLHNRRVFWFIIPAAAVVMVVFIAAFWNANGMLGLPARTIKSVFALDTASTRDQSSSEYRVIENINTGYTIEKTPLTGVGFGNKFFVIIPLPDISFYEWWNYFPHNSIIYMWVKTGIGGFIAMLFLFGSTIILGTRVINRTQDVELKTIFTTVLLYIVMHFVYAYVDIAWDTQSMVYLGACLAILNTAEKVQGLPTLTEPAPRKRKIVPFPIH